MTSGISALVGQPSECHPGAGPRNPGTEMEGVQDFERSVALGEALIASRNDDWGPCSVPLVSGEVAHARSGRLKQLRQDRLGRDLGREGMFKAPAPRWIDRRG